MPPFGSPDGQGPVLVPLLIRVVIEMPPFGSPDGQGPVLVPLLLRVVIEMPPFGSPDGQGSVLVLLPPHERFICVWACNGREHDM